MALKKIIDEDDVDKLNWLPWIIIIVIIVMSSVYLFNNAKKNKINAGSLINETSTIQNQQKWDLLVERWNKSVRNNDFDSTYFLNYSKLEETTDKLNLFLAPFREGFSYNLQDELTQIAREQESVFFSEYQKFIVTNYHPELKIISIDQDFDQVRNLILSATQTRGINKTNTLMSILAMQSPCNFHKLFSSELYSKGMSKSIKNCNDLEINVDKNKFPELSKFLQQ